jgi:hypothetical protein
VLLFFGDPEGEAREALGEDAYESAHSEGHAMTVDEAWAYLLEFETSPAG